MKQNSFMHLGYIHSVFWTVLICKGALGKQFALVPFVCGNLVKDKFIRCVNIETGYLYRTGRKDRE